VNAEVNGAADVAQDPFDEVQVISGGSMHVEACLLDIVLEIGAGYRKILKCPHQTLVRRGVGEHRAGHGREHAVCWGLQPPGIQGIE